MFLQKSIVSVILGSLPASQSFSYIVLTPSVIPAKAGLSAALAVWLGENQESNQGKKLPVSSDKSYQRGLLSSISFIFQFLCSSLLFSAFSVVKKYPPSLQARYRGLKHNPGLLFADFD